MRFCRDLSVGGKNTKLFFYLKVTSRRLYFYYYRDWREAFACYLLLLSIKFTHKEESKRIEFKFSAQSCFYTKWLSRMLHTQVSSTMWVRHLSSLFSLWKKIAVNLGLQQRCMKSYLFKISRICSSIPIILLVVVQFYPWFRFCLFSLCFKLLITHNQTLKQRKIINKMNILNLNKYEFQHQIGRASCRERV